MISGDTSVLIESGPLTARLTPVGRFPWPRPAEDAQRAALVVGPAPGLHEDLDRCPYWHGDCEVFAVNRAVRLTPTRVDHIVTCHPDGLEEWTATRWQGRFRELGIQVHSTLARPGVDFVWGFNPGFGSSGGMAVFIALLLGFSKVYLAGVPLENTGYADDPSSPTDYHDFRPLWEQNLPLLAGRCFSLSGPETFTGRLLPLA
jgi:hypothetical protein